MNNRLKVLLILHADILMYIYVKMVFMLSRGTYVQESTSIVAYSYLLQARPTLFGVES